MKAFIFVTIEFVVVAFFKLILGSIETRSVTMNIFRKKYFLFKSFIKIKLSYVFTINVFSTAESCMEQ